MTNKAPGHESLTENGWRWNYLLIDGIALPEAERQLYQACESPEHLNLFAGPVYGEISDVGPLLVRVSSDHPMVQRLIDEGFTKEWGYLVRSALELPALAAWLRQFIRVKHPAGVDLFLRFAEPAVASVVFGEAGALRRVGTPVDEVLLPDSLDGNWHHIQLTSAKAQKLPEPLVLSGQDVEALTKVDRRSLLKAMVAHLDQFFPHWTNDAERVLQIARLSQLLDLARQAEYLSERALTQWANVFGFLRPGRLPEDLPEPVQALLKAIPQASDAETAAREAAVLARDAVKPTINENSGTGQTT
jgi:hypothetical protein